MYTIRKKEKLAPNIYSMDIDAPRVARKARAGQFVILRSHEEGERIPLTVAGADPEAGTVRVIFQVLGLSTQLMATLEEGQRFADLAGPLGKPSPLPEKGRVLCIGGGVGTAVAYPSIRELHRRGVSVDVIIGARSSDLLILEREIAPLCDRLIIATDDGTRGRKGFVTDALRDLLASGEKYDEVIVIGPIIMMKLVAAITREYGIRTIASLNPIMVDGTGMCGSCRVTVGGEVRYACVDGPDFDAHRVDFDELMNRQCVYRDEEKKMWEKQHCGGNCICR